MNNQNFMEVEFDPITDSKNGNTSSNSDLISVITEIQEKKPKMIKVYINNQNNIKILKITNLYYNLDNKS